MLYILCGFPASGKSTLADEIKNRPQKYGMNAPVVLCPDEVRKALTGDAQSHALEDLVWFAVKSAADKLLHRHRHVVIDATHLTKGQRSQWIRIAQEHEIGCVCLWADTPWADCFHRNLERSRPIPENAMERMKDRFVEPSKDEGFQEIIKLSDLKARLQGYPPLTRQSASPTM